MKVILNLFGADVFSAADNNVFFSIGNQDRAFCRPASNITRMEKPVAGVGFCILIYASRSTF